MSKLFRFFYKEIKFEIGNTCRLFQESLSLESEPHDELSETAFVTDVTRGGLPGPENRFEHTCD